PVGQERDVEDLRAVVGLVLFQQVHQEGREAGLFQDLRDVPIARAESAAAAAVGEDDHGPGAPRLAQDPADGAPARRDRHLPLVDVRRAGIIHEGSSLRSAGADGEGPGESGARLRVPPMSRSSRARASNSATSVSSVWEKSSYHSPTARKGSGVAAQMQSSAI